MMRSRTIGDANEGCKWNRLKQFVRVWIWARFERHRIECRARSHCLIDDRPLVERWGGNNFGLPIRALNDRTERVFVVA